MNLIKVVSVSEIKTASNGREYQTVTFAETPKTVKVGGVEVQVKSNAPTRSRNIWAAFQDFKADPLFKNVKVGDYVEGRLMTFETTPYNIGEGENMRQVSSYSCVIFTGEDAISYANRQLKTSGSEVVSHNEPAEIVPAF